MGSHSVSRMLLGLSWFLCFVSVCTATLVTREVALDAAAQVDVQPHVESILAEVTSVRHDYQAAIEAFLRDLRCC